MNTAHTNGKDKLKALTTSLKFSPNNQALALEYLTAGTCDDALLNKAEPQNFRGLGWKERYAAINHLASIRDSGDRSLLPRYVKLFWAIGRSTTIVLLEQNIHVHHRIWDRSDLIAILGKPAVACVAAPNLKYTFMPHPRYWIAFGKFEEGEVIDVNRMTQKFEIEYPVNVFSRTVELSGNNSWILK